MKPRHRAWIVSAIGVCIAGAVCAGWLFARSPRSLCSQAARAFGAALASGDHTAIRTLVKMPLSLAGKTPEEQAQQIAELLADEISPEGVVALRKNGRFGPLREVFPAEADAWAKAFAVDADDCVAFRMERGGLRAELVLIKQDNQYLVLRCNNVRQMAGELPPS